MSTKEEVTIEIKEKNNQLQELIKKVKSTEIEIYNLREKLYGLDPKYIKVVCPICNGKGYSINQDNKKIICNICLGKEYTWMMLYDKKGDSK